MDQRIAFVTCKRLPEIHDDDRLVANAVQRRGFEVTAAVELCRSAIVFALMVGWLVAGCSSPVPSEQASTQPRRAAPGFVNRVWSVQSSNAVAPGQLYVFLSEETLVIASPNGPPTLGRWKQQDQTFTMIEEGIAYAVEILELTQDRFRIRIRNPGEPVEMTLVPAAP